VPWLLIAPLILWLLVFVVAPTAIMAAYSFAKPGELGRVIYEPTVEHYVRIGEPTYLKIFGRSILYAGVSTALCVLFGYPVAYFIGRSPPRRRNLLLMAVMIPFWTNFLIRTYAWIMILNQQGLLNAALQGLRVTSGPLDMMYTPFAVMVGLVYTYLPFMILPIYGSVEKLDDSLIEAALDLGATPWRAFRGVIVPLTKPGIIAGFLLVFIPAIGQFAINDVLGGKRAPIIGNTIEKQFGAALNKPFGAALGMTLLVMFVLCFAVFRRSEEKT
jgi:spermidine/putrescine transport system permease protein